MYTGWHARGWDAGYDGKKEEFSFGYLRRGEFRRYLTADFWAAFFLWRRCCRRGLPSGKGWAEEPAALLELLDLFDDARDALDRLKTERKESGDADTDNR